MDENQEKKAAMDATLKMAHFLSLLLIPFIFGILGLSYMRMVVLTVLLLALYYSAMGNYRARLIWFGLISFFVYKSIVIFLFHVLIPVIVELSIDYLIDFEIIFIYVLLPISLFIFVVCFMYYNVETENYYFDDEDTKKYVPSFFIVSFFLIILWLCFMARRYTFIQLITYMDALVVPLFPITALLLIKEEKIGFLFTPFLFVSTIITGFNYMFRFETKFEFIDVYCVIAVFVFALFILNIKKREGEQTPGPSDSDGEAKIGT